MIFVVWSWAVFFEVSPPIKIELPSVLKIENIIKEVLFKMIYYDVIFQ